MTTETQTSRLGFTLSELLMVLAILSLTALIVTPQMLEASSLRAQAAGRAIVADVLFAQNDAIARQAERRVVFNVTSDSYELTDGAGATIDAGWTGGDHKVDFKTDKRFDGVQLLSADFDGDTVLTFDALGAPASSGQVELLCGDTRYRITVAAVTGRVVIEPVDSEE